MTRFGGFKSANRGLPGNRNQRKKLRTLIVERLEARHLLAADLGISPALHHMISRELQPAVTDRFLLSSPTEVDFGRDISEAVRDGKQPVEATHFYYADGQPQGMVVYPDRIALGLRSDIVGPYNPQWMEAFGLTERRSLPGSNFSVFVSSEPFTDSFLDTLKQVEWLEAVVPVFEVLESQSETVLLNETIVRLPESVSAEQFFTDSRFNSFRPLPGTHDHFVAELSAGYGEQALAEINRLSRDADVISAEPNFFQDWQRFFIPNDPRWSNLWHLQNTGQSATGPNAVPGLAGTDVNVTEAWDIKQGSNSSIVIGVLDDGVPAPLVAGISDHPDLLNYVGDALGGPDTNANGWIGDRWGWNFVDNNFASYPQVVQDGHGTAVAGLAAAIGNNGTGVVGPAYGSPILSARIFNGPSATSTANITSAVYYAAGRTLDGLGQWDASTIVNHSWGGGAPSTALTEAFTWATTTARGGKGVLQVFASGNSGGAVGYPASLAGTNPGILVVGSINNAGELSAHHSRGALLDVVAPSDDYLRTGPGGEQIYLAIDTTDRRGSAGYNTAPSPDGDYTGTGAAGFGGTSASAPIAAGVAALAMARAEDLSVDLTAAEMRRLIRNNTQLAGGVGYSITTGRNVSGGFGLINAGSLVSGIGNAQLSVTTSFAEIPDGSSGWTFGEVFVGSISQAVLRIRNQGTETLDISNISLSGAPGFSVSQPNQSILGLGDATTFVLTLNPLTVGPQSTVVTILSNDASSPSFTFELDVEVVEPDAFGFVFEDRNGDGVRQTGEAVLANRLMFMDTNSNGLLDTFGTTTFVNNTPQSIPSNQPATIISTIDVSGVTDYTDVTLKLNISHTWVSDLAIFLESPTGELSLLINQRGGSADDMTNTLFDDNASQSIAQGTAPFTGSFRPETPLSVFRGLSPSEVNGEWSLIILDLFELDGGILNNWELNFVSRELSSRSDAFGFFAFSGTPDGTFALTREDEAGWTAAPAAPATYPVILPNPNPGQPYANLNFGIGRNNRFYAQVFEDTNGNGAFDVGEAPRSGRTLFIDGNNNGTLDGQVQTDWLDAPGTAFGGEVIGTPATILATQTVSGLAGVLQDVDVKLNISHTWISDLRITLIAPDNSEVLLFNRRGNLQQGQNMINTVFDDDAAVSITTATAANAPFTGSWRPEQPLSLLNGIDPNGIWGLRVEDLFPTLDDGVLNDWTLSIITSPDTPFVTGADGWAAIDLEAGSYDILLTDVGFNFTVPADGRRMVTASGSPLFNQTYGERDALPAATIVDRFVYHGGYSGAGSPIDTGKVLAKEGGTAQTLTLNNLINTSRGINGLAFDIANLPGSVSASDFVFQASPFGSFNEEVQPPASWIAAPDPSSITVTPGSPSRVLIQWPDNAIANRWLRVTVLANANTGLQQPEVYYIGHLRGETTGASGGVFTVSFADITPIRSSVGSTVNASSTVDIDKNGVINFADIAAMRGNVGAQLTAVTIPASAGLLSTGPGGSGKSSKGDTRGGSDGSSAAPPVDAGSFVLLSGTSLGGSSKQDSKAEELAVSVMPSLENSTGNRTGSLTAQLDGANDTIDQVFAVEPSTADGLRESTLARDSYFEQLSETESLGNGIRI